MCNMPPLRAKAKLKYAIPAYTIQCRKPAIAEREAQGCSGNGFFDLYFAERKGADKRDSLFCKHELTQ